MNEQELISVVIPIYKVEQYLRACLDSVLAQTYQNLEVILVDDGSPDGSGAICDEYAARDPRIRVIHQENGGLSAARNAGLAIARGTCIGFVDPDDYIDPDMYRAMHERLQATGVDVVQCRHRGISEDGGLIGISPDAGDVVLEREDAIKAMFTGPIQVVCWSKLYHREILSGFQFDVSVQVSEDIIFTYLLLKKGTRMALMRDVYYNYVEHPFSLSNAYSKKPGIIDVYRIVLADITDNFPRLTDYPHFSVCGMLIRIYEQAHPLLDRRAKTAPARCKEQRAWAVKELRKELRRCLSNPISTKKDKRKAFLIAFFPHLYPQLLCLRRRLLGIAP